ncbi:MFS general substrate transporter [Didymella exigua CBS 183.55]|uniref:MFS general substrate transporter n=1 Tax=Didymella exigua CBS 183.55 TaxID=1150837 RepID=A0A6A5RKA4_9PLEO|nr:MFS general substrate transporter [Didymella exigua CBS 183.55]KAF1926826.1 MFS general substrate transporter [Didymella exigua CBS 183.55]
MATVDEQQPLLRPIVEDAEADIKHDEVILDFEKGDVENPREWDSKFKWFIVFLLAFMAFTVTFTCIGVVPIAASIVDELEGEHGGASTTALLVTIWELGEAAGPLLIAPLSEVFGRYPVMNGCNIIFIIATLLAAGSKSTHLLIAARWLTGFAVASNVLNPSIIGDIFDSDQRGSAMSLISLAPLIGGAVGPAIAGAIAQTLGWRQVLLMAAGLAVIAEILFLTCFRETYKMAILHSRIARIKRESGEFKSEVAVPRNRNEDLLKIWHALTRPFAVLFGSSVLMALSLQASVSFSFFYVMSISLPSILQETYGFNPAETGAAFIIFSIGSLLSVLLCNSFLDRIYIRLRNRSAQPDTGKPEYRLPLAVLGAVLLPFSVTAYGWTAHLALPVPLLLASVALLDFALLTNIIPLQAYVVDACGLYSASAMTGVIVTRCLMGTFLPLATEPLHQVLGYGWGFTVLGGLAAAVAVVPVAVFRYGGEWRQRSEYTRDA